MTYLFNDKVKVDNKITLESNVVSLDESSRVLGFNPNEIFSDASGRARVSQLTTLFDGKVINEEDTVIWETVGTGTSSFANNGVILSVTEGQYEIRQSQLRSPYFSGKSQLVEMTFDNFSPEEGVIKRYGYFSSANTAPYDSVYDGFYIESSNNTIKLVVENTGNKTLDLNWTQWDNYSLLQNYNFNNFTVCVFDFLWLGGAIIRVFFKNPNGGFILAHTYNYAGNSPGIFIRSPHQPLRYEIRSTTGIGSFNTICSQIASEGSLAEEGKAIAIYNPSLLGTNVVGTVYALKGVRKTTSRIDNVLKLMSIGAAISTTGDTGLALLLLNPTLSAPLTWVNNGIFEDGTATNQTITNTGRVLDCFPIVSAGYSKDFSDNILSWLSSKIDGTPNELILAYVPLTAQQSVAGTMKLLQY